MRIKHHTCSQRFIRTTCGASNCFGRATAPIFQSLCFDSCRGISTLWPSSILNNVLYTNKLMFKDKTTHRDANTLLSTYSLDTSVLIGEKSTFLFHIDKPDMCGSRRTKVSHNPREMRAYKATWSQWMLERRLPYISVGEIRQNTRTVPYLEFRIKLLDRGVTKHSQNGLQVHNQNHSMKQSMAVLETSLQEILFENIYMHHSLIIVVGRRPCSQFSCFGSWFLFEAAGSSLCQRSRDGQRHHPALEAPAKKIT